MPRTRSSRRTKNLRAALLFLLPAIAIYAVFFGFGFAFLFQTSLTKVSISFFDPIFVGFQNYVTLFEDERFLRSIVNNLAFGALSIVAALTISFFIAVALATGARARGLYYVLFLLPSLMPVARATAMKNEIVSAATIDRAPKARLLTMERRNRSSSKRVT